MRLSALLLIFVSPFAEATITNSIMYQARIVKPDGTPLESNATFQFTIKSPTGCILWSENMPVTMTNSKGAISVEVGLGANISTGSHQFSDIFSNSGTLTGLTGCGGGTYTPSSNDDRTLSVSFHDGTSLNSLPNLAIRAVPFANFATVANSALRLMDIPLSATAPTDGQVLKFNNGSGKWEASTLSGIGTVTSVGLAGSSIFNITGGPITSAGTINLGLASQNANLILASPDGTTGAPTFRALLASDIPTLDAAKVGTGTFATARLGTIPASIISGTLATAQVGNIDASQITTGTLSVARLPDLDAGKVVSGTFATARLGSIPASIVTGTLASAQIGDLDASMIVTGTFASARLGTLDASKITTGTLAAAVGGTGLVPTAGNANQVYGVNAAGNGTEFKTIAQGSGVTISNSTGTIVISATGSGGSVTNVGLAMPSIFNVANSPVTTAGTMNVTLANAAQNAIFAGPSTGGAGTPSFRALAASDIPSLDASIITAGTFATARLGTIPTSLLSGTLASAQMGITPAANGGTGLDGGSAANGQLLIGNGSGYTLATLGISNGLTQTLSAGGIALSTNAQTTNSNNTLVMRDGSGGFAAGTATLQSLVLQGLGTVGINTPATANYNMTLPVGIGSPGQVLRTDGTGALSWISLPVGSVTNVGMTGNSLFNITGGPVTGAGTFNLDLASQNQNLILASPTGSSGTPSFRSLASSDIPNLAASKITSGTLNTAQIGALDASIVTTGTFATARLGQIPASLIDGTLASSVIGNIDASQVTTGTFATARVPDLDAGKVVTGTFATARIPDLDASKIVTGTLASARLGTLDASKITTGTLAAAVGGTGLVPAAGNANQLYGVNAAGNGTEFKTITNGAGVTVSQSNGTITIAATGSGGTVTNVGLSGDSAFAITGSPINGFGTMNIGWASQAQNLILASPTGGSGTPSFRGLAASDIPNLAASKITSGTLNTAQIGALDASIITTGTFATARLGNIPASIISGTLASAVVGNIDASQVTTGTFATARVPDLDAGKVVTGTFATARIPDLDASKIVTGTLATARIGSLPASAIATGTLSAAVGGTGLVPAVGHANKVYAVNAAGNGTEYKSIVQGSGVTVDTSVAGQITISATGSGGSVTNVGLAMPSIFNVANSPVTTAGTMNVTLANAAQNAVFAGPASGGAGTPSFRGLAASDIPNLPASILTSGTLNTAQIGSLDASIVTTGTFATARLGQIPASIVSGTLATAQLGIVPAANGGTGLNGGSAANGTLLIGNGSGYTLATLNISNGLSQTLGAGSISLTTNATNNNTASAIVARDPSGNFSAGAIDVASTGIRGGTAGTATINAPASFTNYTFTLPSSMGSAGQVLQTNGTSATTWVSAPVNGGTILAASGSAGTPGISFNSDQDTGLWNPGANTLAISTGGSERMRIDSSGYVGIGTTPSYNLHVASASSYVESVLEYTGSTANGAEFGIITYGAAAGNRAVMGLKGARGAKGSATYLQAGDEAGYIYGGDAQNSGQSGRISFGAESNWSSSSLPGYLAFSTTPSNQTNPAEQMRITSGGSVGIGTSTPKALLDVNGSSRSASHALVGSGTVTLNAPSSGNYSLRFPTSVGSPGQALVTDGTSGLSWSTISAGGVTNVGLSGNSMFSITGSPVTGAGTMNINWASQAQNLVLASPNGSSGTPSFRALAAADITTGTFALARLGTIPMSQISGTLATANIGLIPAANGGTGLDGSSAANGRLLIGNGSGYTLGTLSISNGLSQTLGAGSVSLTTNATNNNTASAIVARDPSGNFSAGAVDVASIGLRGSTTGVLTMNTPASFTNYTFTLPSSMGSPGQVLQTNGTSATTWVSAPVNGGTILAASGSAGTPGITFNSDQDTGLWNPGANTLALSTNGNERLRVDSSGDVGIGTTNVTHRLTIADSNSGSTVKIHNTAAAGYAELQYADSSDTARAYIGVGNSSAADLDLRDKLYLDTNGLPISFLTGGNPRMEITTSGSVGIGTTSPKALFEVNGASRSNSHALVGSGTVTLNAPASGNYSLSWPTSVGSPGQVLATNGTSALSWVTPSAGSVSFPLLSTTLGSAGTPVYSFNADSDTGLWSPAGNVLAVSTGGNERMRIDGNGNIAVGTTNTFDRMVLMNSANSGTSMTITTPGTQANQQAAFALATKDNSTYVGGTGTKGWQFVARGDAYTNASQRNDFLISYYDGSSWKDPLSIDSLTGNVGIGTAPLGPLTIASDVTIKDPDTAYSFNMYWDTDWKAAQTGRAAALKHDSSGNIYFLQSTGSTTAGATVTTREPFYIDSAGEVGIGTSSPQRTLHVVASSGQSAPSDAEDVLLLQHNSSASQNAGLRIIGGNTGWTYIGLGDQENKDAGIILYDHGADSLRFATNGNWSSPAMFINSGGSIGIGTTTPGQKLDVSGNVQATAFLYTSDRRLKTDIQDMKGLETILRMRGVKFKWIADGKPEIGLIAQEVEAVAPELVITNPVTGMKSVKYGNMVSPLIEATKELYEQLVITDQKVEKLKSENEELKSRLDRLEKAVKRLSESR